MTSVDTVTIDELYAYIRVLENETSSLEATVERLNDENSAMRRSIASYRAHATIRKNRREAVAA